MEADHAAKLARWDALPERDLYGEPVEHWHAVSPVLGLPYEAMEFQLPGTLRTVTVKRFRVPIDGYDS